MRAGSARPAASQPSSTPATGQSSSPTDYAEVDLGRGRPGRDGTELTLHDDGALTRRSVLPGGVRVITESVPGLRSASIGMWFGVGSRDEVPGQEGATHFLEHLLFKGTATRDAHDIAEAFDMIGGESNAATSKEHTSYYARVLAPDSMSALEVLADLATSGWDASPDAAPRERRFEIEPFAPLDVHDITVPRESEQSHLYLTCQGIAVRDERRWAMSVLTTILGGGMSSRLFQEVREKRGLAYTTYAFDTSYAGAGAFGLYAGCAPGDVDEVCAVMIGEFEKLAERGVTEREMMRARGQLRGAMVLGGEDSLARMGRLGRAEVVTGRLRSMRENLRRLEAVTPEEVQEMAAWLVEQKRARILVGPVD